jgi:hypothetical protein
MQDLDSILYAAYVDGRGPEREDMRRSVVERAETVPIEERAAYLNILLMLCKPRPIPELPPAASGPSA